MLIKVYVLLDQGLVGAYNSSAVYEYGGRGGDIKGLALFLRFFDFAGCFWVGHAGSESIHF
jgi:hypothetical protein